MTENEIELSAQAEAGVKLAMIGLEFVANLAATLGKDINFIGAADSLMNAQVLDDAGPELFRVEKRAREVAVEKLRILADAYGQTRQPPRLGI